MWFGSWCVVVKAAALFFVASLLAVFYLLACSYLALIAATPRNAACHPAHLTTSGEPTRNCDHHCTQHTVRSPGRLRLSVPQFCVS